MKRQHCILLILTAAAHLTTPEIGATQDHATFNTRTSIINYNQQQEAESIEAWQTKNQISSIRQLSNLKPTDWIYQALSNLVEKFGCVAGYPDGKFKGALAISRFEAAAILNACIDRVTEKTDELQKLLSEFDKELTMFSARVDGLEGKAGRLQDQEFATTTRLNGEAYMMLNGIPGFKVAGVSGYGATTFNYDIRLNFDTSYNGQDLLRARLNTSNFSTYPFGSPANNILKLDKAENWDSKLALDRLYYIFPISEEIKVILGALINNTEVAWLPSAYKSDILDYFSTGGASGVYNKATGEGLAFQWRQKAIANKPAWIAIASYVVNGRCGGVGASGNGACGADSSYGVFNSRSGINAFGQLGLKGNNWGAGLGYRHGTQNSTFRVGNSAAGNSLVQGQTSNAIALNAYWQPIKTNLIPSISAGYGYNFISGTPTNGASPQAIAQSSRSWMTAFQWDRIFGKPNVAGIAVGQPANAAGAQGSSPWLWEFFYRLQVSDNITVTPELFYASNSSVTTSNSTTQPSGWTGWGGVIQTMFKF